MKGAAAGTLYVVATPIGNLEDITLRALRVLREVAVVAAEDTRHTGNLLRHYQIGTPLLSLHEHNEHTRREEVVRRLRAGDSIALVTDAGTPGISDPGAGVVRAVRDNGLRVEPVPGASAVTAALSGAGLPLDRFAFAGFAPIRSKARKKWLAWVGGLEDIPIVLFEAPHRLQKTLSDLSQILVNRPIIAARELTKVHEEWLSGTAEELRHQIQEPRGEFVIIIGPISETKEPSVVVADTDIAVIFGQITDNGVTSRREAIRMTAKRLGLPQKVVYQALEQVKKSAECP
jgi:16S rRNA (cytidine1402-2'-O)-methyltransferase